MSEQDDSPGLAKYRKKRDPGRTNEPFAPEPVARADGQRGAEQRGDEPTWVGAFVVHEHHATRRHFDLRLEVGGVLKSFAVPRGPSLDPGERRLAIQTEDHPLAYLDYEGVIPEANYGAGPMIVWDTGVARYLEHAAERGLATGKVDFELRGFKLRGRFALILTAGRGSSTPGQKQWILMKKRDAHADPDSGLPDALPESVLSGLSAAQLSEAAERAGALRQAATALAAKRGALRASRLSPMASASDGAILQDPAHVYELRFGGVRVLADKMGDEVALYYRPGRSAAASFPELARALRALSPRRLLIDAELVAYDERGHPDPERLVERFGAARPDRVRRAQLSAPAGLLAFDLLALEDLVLLELPLLERKALLARLLPARGPIRMLDHVVGDGRELLAFGREHRLAAVIAKRADSPYRPGPRASGDWREQPCASGQSGSAAALLERVSSAADAGHPAREAADRGGAAAGSRAGTGKPARAAAQARGRVRLTNPNKVYWPEEGYTKGELCAYYEAIAPALLPFLRDRPVILVRYPDGIRGKSFYQWNAPRGTPSWVPILRVAWDRPAGKEAELFLIENVETLLYVANLGCIPLHILAARSRTLSGCDFLTIDFDLNGQPLAHAITLARALKQLLERLALAGYAKTSGQTGLHVLVPLGPNVPFETARTLADLLGRLLVAQHRELATMERIKTKRGPRVYVDTGQTGTIRAIVAPYSVRAYPGARVSTPLTWDEVGFALDPGQFTMFGVPDRVARYGDPMAGLLQERPELARALAALERLLPRS